MPIKSISEIDKITLNQPKVAAVYLSAVYSECLEDDNFEAFLIALRDLIQANQGMGSVAKSAGVGRQALYNMLSENGNPQLYKLSSVLKAVGLKIKFVA